MQVFQAEMLKELVDQAKVSSRLRQHKNIHTSYQEPCQRLFNAIEVGSYIRPHKHASDPRDEMLVAVRGLMALLSFDDQGAVVDVVRFGSEAFGPELAVGVELSAKTWHTVVALVPGCVLLEVKAGPFDPNQPKDLAPWAPEEGSSSAQDYLTRLFEKA
ncbi:MAG: WbuC family cupin fold metalloprotein [Burkholderiales bacterium]